MLWAQDTRFYEKLMAMDDMKDFEDELKIVANMNNFGSWA